MKNRQGMTLIEILIAITILGLVMASINQMLDLGLKSWQRNDIQAEAEQNIRIALEKIKSEAQIALALDDKSSSSMLVLVFPDNVEISYSLGPLISEDGPGGLKGFPLQRIYTKYSDADRNYPLSEESQDIAGYLNTVEFSYYIMGIGGTLQSIPLPQNATYVELRLACHLPKGEVIENKIGIALRGKFLPGGES